MITKKKSAPKRVSKVAKKPKTSKNAKPLPKNAPAKRKNNAGLPLIQYIPGTKKQVGP